MGVEGPLGGVRPICELKGSGHRLKPRPPSFASHCLTSDFSRLAVWPWGVAHSDVPKEVPPARGL